MRASVVWWISVLPLLNIEHQENYLINIHPRLQRLVRKSYQTLPEYSPNVKTFKFSLLFLGSPI